MKLNLGCGTRKLLGFLNVDKEGTCHPDEVADLEKPFPRHWKHDSVDEVVLSHVLEHLGRDQKIYLRFFQELYRVCQNGAIIHIAVPHPRHDHFLGDPTHVRPITIEGLQLFSQAQNANWIKEKAANTPLAKYLKVDFEVVRKNYVFDKRWSDKIPMTPEQLNFAVASYNNVIQEIQVDLMAVKPLGRLIPQEWR
jgi:SAM-dependent methyltransferase